MTSKSEDLGSIPHTDIFKKMSDHNEKLKKKKGKIEGSILGLLLFDSFMVVFEVIAVCINGHYNC